ncbi:MAG TPA: beta-ketoacyl-ACP synthase II [Nocardioidaceae bacterium]|jgi:3-oxoacyl-[acyl-carrier-protein] synthase II|nr:beta-ketoacyl-ACP synthase II [Nocardioidaceae bacterium]
MSPTRVVVTGLGITSPLGGDVKSSWQALLEGRSGVSRLDQDWAEQLPAQIAGQAAVEPTEVIERVKARRLDRAAQFAVVAAKEAWADAGLEDAEIDTDRLGVAIATGIGGVKTLLANYDALNEKGPRRVSPLAVPMLMANSPAANVGLMLGARAGVHTPVSACASGNEGISVGVDMIRLGRADVVVVGGTEASVLALPMAAFAQMMALSKRNDEPERASRPWDVDRDGFVLSEGGAVLVIESAEHAAARGARVYADVAGAGISADSHDIAQPEPGGTGASLAMRRALAESDLAPSDIVHINAHATSTPQGDVAEALAIRSALGDAADGMVVTGTKSMTGHLLGAAGAFESITTVLSLHHRRVPPTINLDKLDDAIDLDIATSVRDLPEGDLAALNNSFGFGGHNVAVAFRTA